MITMKKRNATKNESAKKPMLQNALRYHIKFRYVLVYNWRMEEYYESLKSNAAIAKSPTKTIITQISHIIMSMIAVFKLKCLKINHSLNHFALKDLSKANMAAK